MLKVELFKRSRNVNGTLAEHFFKIHLYNSHIKNQTDNINK